MQYLEVGLGLPQVVHLDHQEGAGTLANFEFQFVQVSLDLIVRLGISQLLVL